MLKIVYAVVGDLYLLRHKRRALFQLIRALNDAVDSTPSQ